MQVYGYGHPYSSSWLPLELFFLVKSIPAMTSTQITKLQSTKEEINAHNSVIWKVEQGEV